MELELKIHREPWSGTYLCVMVTLPTGETATAYLNLSELESYLRIERDSSDEM